MDKKLYIAILIAVVLAAFNTLNPVNNGSYAASGTEITGAQVSSSPFGPCEIQNGKAICSHDGKEYSSVISCLSMCSARGPESPAVTPPQPIIQPKPSVPTPSATTTCATGGKILIPGIRTENRFCGKNGRLILQKSANYACTENYECSSNVCRNRNCVSKLDIIKKLCESKLISKGCTCCTGDNAECTGPWGKETCETTPPPRRTTGCTGGNCKPDLTIDKPIVHNVGSSLQAIDELELRTTYSITANISNKGSGNAGDSQVNLTIVGTSYPILKTVKTYRIRGIDAGKYRQEAFDFNLSSLPQGNYYFLIFVDALKELEELNESNNVNKSSGVSVVVQTCGEAGQRCCVNDRCKTGYACVDSGSSSVCQVTKTDIAVDDLLVLTDPVVIGSTFEVAATISNKGNANAGSFDTKLYLVEYARPGLMFLGSINTRSLNADEVITLNFKTALPLSKGIVPSGDRYWFMAKVYPRNAADSGNKTNDYSTTTVIPLHDQCSSTAGSQCSTYKPCCESSDLYCLSGSCVYHSYLI